MQPYCSFAKKIKIVMYFDEAHELSRHRPTDSKGNVAYNYYDAFCNSLNLFLGLPIFTIFLSTHSSLTVLSPPREDHPSTRARVGHLQAPITETPFDCSPAFPLKLENINYDDICRIEFLSQFGRPMYTLTLFELAFLLTCWPLGSGQFWRSTKASTWSVLLGGSSRAIMTSTHLNPNFLHMRSRHWWIS